MSKITHTPEEAEKDFKEKGYIINKAEYKTTKTVLHITCEHEHLFLGSYNSVITNHRGCPICAKEKRANSRKLTEEEIKRRYLEKGFELLEKEYNKYKNRTTKLYCKCLKDGTICEFNLNQIATNILCPTCRKKTI